MKRRGGGEKQHETEPVRPMTGHRPQAQQAKRPNVRHHEPSRPPPRRLGPCSHSVGISKSAPLDGSAARCSGVPGREGSPSPHRSRIESPLIRLSSRVECQPETKGLRLTRRAGHRLDLHGRPDRWLRQPVRLVHACCVPAAPARESNRETVLPCRLPAPNARSWGPAPSTSAKSRRGPGKLASPLGAVTLGSHRPAAGSERPAGGSQRSAGGPQPARALSPARFGATLRASASALLRRAPAWSAQPDRRAGGAHFSA